MWAVSGYEEVRTLARSNGPSGEVALRRRITDGKEIDELIVNGTFAMDSAEVSTERELARIVAHADAAVLIGGLGLGYTAAELLRLGVAEIDVVELEPALVDWAREGLTATLASVAGDARTQLHVADIADVLLDSECSPILGSKHWDAILLDVDNGPDFLIHSANARLYRSDLLAAAAGRLRPGGTLAIWCQGQSVGLADVLSGLDGTVEVRLLDIVRGSRAITYAIYALTR